jgi:sec-independent protein translocase protein TatA
MEEIMIPSASELVLILLIVVMVFGAKRIPEIMGGIGKGIKSFKHSLESDEPLQDSQPKGPGEKPDSGKTA